MMPEKKGTYARITFIDILKSIACLCVLVGHVINGMLKDGMEVATLLRVVNSYVYLFHVPCFFFASGYLYANKPVETWSGYPRFAGKKLIALGLPYFVCSTAYILFSSVLSSDMHTSYSFDAILRLGTAPVAQYWYLYALFEMFLIVPVVELILRRAGGKWILLFFIVCALFVHSDVSCIGYAASYTCFFYMGSYCRQTGVMETGSFMREKPYRLLAVSCVTSMAVYAFYQFVAAGNIFTGEINYALRGILKLLLVVTITGVSCAAAMMDHPAVRFLIWLSQYSLYIYLFHTWFTGTARVLLRKAGIVNCWAQAVCGIAVGLAGSLTAAVIIRKVPFFRFWFEPFSIPIKFPKEIKKV